jgi:hypothetical protein
VALAGEARAVAETVGGDALWRPPRASDALLAAPVSPAA